MSGTNTNLIETESVTIDGDPLVVYNLTIRLRAAVELMAYTGGIASRTAKRFYTGGTPKSYPNTQVKLVVSDPAETYYLNRTGSVPTNFSFGLDYYFTIPVRGGATLTLSLVRGDHVMYDEDQGGGAVVTSLDAYDGEFARIDFVTTVVTGSITEERSNAGGCRGWLWSGHEENVLGTKAEK